MCLQDIDKQLQGDQMQLLELKHRHEHLLVEQQRVELVIDRNISNRNFPCFPLIEANTAEIADGNEKLALFQQEINAVVAQPEAELNEVAVKLANYQQSDYRKLASIKQPTLGTRYVLECLRQLVDSTVRIGERFSCQCFIEYFVDNLQIKPRPKHGQLLKRV
jgi:hypothetical protein